MKIKLAFSLALCLITFTGLFAQEEDFRGLVSQKFYARVGDRDLDPDLQGVGARTLGMGRTGIANASDLSAIYWNPAQVTALNGPQFTFHMRMNLDQREFTPPERIGMNVASEINPAFAVHFIAVSYPIFFGSRKIVISGSLQNLNNLGRKIVDQQYYYGGNISREEKSIAGNIFSFSPSIAVDLLPQVSIGVTYNKVFGKSDFKLTIGSPYADRTVYYEFKDREEYSGSFFNAGVAVKPTNWLSLGLSTSSSWDFAIKEGNESWKLINRFSTGTKINYDEHITPSDSLYETMINIPMKMGAGLAIKPLSNVTLAADYQILKWSDASVTVEGQASDVELLDTKVIRGGLEWVLDAGMWQMPVRFGYYTSPTPMKDKWFIDHYEGDQIEGDVWTVGLGYVRTKFNVDFSLERGSHEVSWWMDPGDYYNNRLFKTKDVTNRVTLSFTYHM